MAQGAKQPRAGPKHYKHHNTQLKQYELLIVIGDLLQLSKLLKLDILSRDLKRLFSSGQTFVQIGPKVCLAQSDLIARVMRWNLKIIQET